MMMVLSSMVINMSYDRRALLYGISEFKVHIEKVTSVRRTTSYIAAVATLTAVRRKINLK